MGDHSRFLQLGSGVRKGKVYCDACGCEESHPLEHEELGEPSFGTGRWLGWVYLDVNRPDLIDRDLRFCSVSCCSWWLERETMLACKREPTALDVALRNHADPLARAHAGLRSAQDEVARVRSRRKGPVDA